MQISLGCLRYNILVGLLQALINCKINCIDQLSSMYLFFSHSYITVQFLRPKTQSLELNRGFYCISQICQLAVKTHWFCWGDSSNTCSWRYNRTHFISEHWITLFLQIHLSPVHHHTNTNPVLSVGLINFFFFLVWFLYSLYLDSPIMRFPLHSSVSSVSSLSVSFLSSSRPYGLYLTCFYEWILCFPLQRGL